MRYQSLHQLKSRFGDGFDYASSGDFLNQVNPENALFLNHIQHPNALIFLGWMERIKGLETLLVDGKTPLPFSDDLKILEHALVNEFKQFLTPLLAPVLLKQHSFDQPTNSYLVLIENDTRLVVENHVFKQILVAFETVETHLEATIGEQELINKTQAFVNDDVIGIINSFSRSSYALKLNYVDKVLSIVNAKSCTVRLANWILKQLEKLTLNQEHQYKINDLRNELKTGNLKVRNVNTKKGASFSLRNVSFTLLFALISGFLAYLIWYKPWSESEKPVLANNSSFTTFSKEERKQIDSLLKVIQPQRKLNTEEVDLGTYFAEELELVMRTPFKNVIAEKYYQDVTLVLQQHDALRKDSCGSSTSTKKLIPSNMESISSKKNGKTAFFKNESDYDVQLIVFRNFLSSDVYYKLIPAGKTTKLPLEIGDWLLLIPGKEITDFDPPKNYTGPLPSDDFNVHFCELDENLIHGLNTSFTLLSNGRTSYKFLILGSETEQFDLVDIHSVLETH